MDEVVILERAQRPFGGTLRMMQLVDATRSHFATCPMAERFKKKKAQPTGCGQGCAGEE